ncbi:hypothetical protein P5673_014554 [Acropora cervicornis]|uniref:Uncharacterized protein n=1 Tax=Acropora cervicornis TaxID=6130 RepID=A0AAD9QJF4_ACRCE|nr:hypothetical protein P5673_014554 [Acropora cervicornis]
MIAGATGCTRHKLSALTSSSSDMSSDNAGIPGGNQVVETHLGQNVKSKKSSLENNLLKRPLNLAANRRSVMQANGNMLISSKNHEGSSSSTGLQTSSAKEHFADTGPVRAHISCSMMSCEVVDIRELPHTSQSGTNDPLSILNKSSVS